MSWDPTPWMIRGGARHSAGLARTFAYASTSGREGIVDPGDLKVTAKSPAGNRLLVDAGTGIFKNRSAGARQQSYIATNNAQHETDPVTATGSGGGRSDLVVARVEDPEYSPWQPPADFTTGVFVRTFIVQGVSASTRKASQLNLGYPAIALARIDIPANTATITDSMIVDLRRVARPNTELETLNILPGVTRDVTSSSIASWLPHSVEVPEWATRAHIKADVYGAAIHTGNFIGEIRVSLGGQLTQATPIDENWTGNPYRTNYGAASPVLVEENIKGLLNAGCSIYAKRTSGPGILRADSGTSAVIQIQFRNDPA